MPFKMLSHFSRFIHHLTSVSLMLCLVTSPTVSLATTTASFSTVSQVQCSSQVYGIPGGNLGWECPLQKIQQSLTGPVAKAIAILAIFGCVVSLVFIGGEMSEFIRRMVLVVLGVAILVGSVSFFDNLGFAQGALIARSSGPPVYNESSYVTTPHATA